MQDNYCPRRRLHARAKSRVLPHYPRQDSSPSIVRGIARPPTRADVFAFRPRPGLPRSACPPPPRTIKAPPRRGHARGRGQTCEHRDRYAFIICKGGNNNIVVSRDTSPPSAPARGNQPSRGRITRAVGLIGIRGSGNL